MIVAETTAAVAALARAASTIPIIFVNVSDPIGNGFVASLAHDRARKLQYFFTQPFIVAEPYTKRPGVTVSLAEALCTWRGILDGQYDDLPTDAFYSAAAWRKSERTSGGPARAAPSHLKCKHR